MFLKKKIVPWEVQYGQIMFAGDANRRARELFKEFFGKSFILDTFNGKYENRNFYVDPKGHNLRISCTFFRQLTADDEFFLSIKDENTILISKAEPENVNIHCFKDLKKDEPLWVITELYKENQKLKETIEELEGYKERYERYESLHKIFKDEAFMEDWLERNINYALRDLDVISRQYHMKWADGGNNFVDLLCCDHTTRELVIVENKVRKRDKTAIEQLLTYKAWAEKNLDFLNTEFKGKNLRATENLKIVVITDEASDELQTKCELHSIPLICIRGGVIFDEIVPYI